MQRDYSLVGQVVLYLSGKIFELSWRVKFLLAQVSSTICLPSAALRQSVSEFIADASAILAYARGEQGDKKVARVREQCLVATLNVLEVFSRLVRYDVPVDRVQAFLRETFPRVVELDRDLAETSAVLHTMTRKLGLSYGDCVCLALGGQRKATVLTADRRWKEVDIDVHVELIR